MIVLESVVAADLLVAAQCSDSARVCGVSAANDCAVVIGGSAVQESVVETGSRLRDAF